MPIEVGARYLRVEPPFVPGVPFCLQCAAGLPLEDIAGNHATPETAVLVV